MRHFYTVFFWLLLYCFSLLFLSIIYRGSTKFSRIESFIFRDVKQNNKGFYSFFECNRLDEEKSEGKMKNDVGVRLETKIRSKVVQNENGLQRLVAYYQSLFDRDENLNHYSPDDYQNARRKFVKYQLESRETI